jgi:hypothetical protein
MSKISGGSNFMHITMPLPNEATVYIPAKSLQAGCIRCGVPFTLLTTVPTGIVECPVCKERFGVEVEA